LLVDCFCLQFDRSKFARRELDWNCLQFDRKFVRSELDWNCLQFDRSKFARRELDWNCGSATGELNREHDEHRRAAHMYESSKRAM
jgi:hypothetical protein